jgi:hypothetical protein
MAFQKKVLIETFQFSFMIKVKAFQCLTAHIVSKKNH